MAFGLLLLAPGCKRSAAPPAGTVAARSADVAAASAVLVSKPVRIESVGDPRTGSAVALGKVSAKTLAFVADEDGLAVRVVDTESMQETSSLALGGRPGQLLVTNSGQLWVTLRDEASVAVFVAREDRTLERLKTLPTSAEPLALATVEGEGVTPAVLVASGWGHTLERFDAVAFTRDLAVDLPREPRAVLASRDGSKAFVAHAAHGGLSVVTLSDAAHAVASVDLGEAARFDGSMSTLLMEPPPPTRRSKQANLESLVDAFGTGAGFADLGGRSFTIPARFARQGFSLVSYPAKTGESVLVPNAEMMTGNPKVVSSGYGGGGVEDAELSSEQLSVSAIDVATSKRLSVKDPTAHGCRLPRAAGIAEDTLLLACVGADEVVAVSAADPTRYIASLPVAAGPTGLAVDPVGKNVYVFSLFDGALTSISLDAFTAPSPVTTRTKNHAAARTAPAVVPRVLRFARPSSLGEVAERGRRIFHRASDPRIAKDGRACASCHPDGRDDGLVWSTPDGPRQTISLAGRVRHQAPFGWMGKHGSLQEHMRATMKNLKGKGLAPEDEEALATYLTAMKGPPSVTSARALTAEEQQGRALFASDATSCAMCHGGPDKSDHDVHDVDSKTPVERSGTLLAPSLVGIAGSAPYFHDGRYGSLEELLDRSDGKMGSTASLSPADKGALVAYLRTL